MDIQTFRKERGLSQADFATLVSAHGPSASQALISHWEQGRVAVLAERAMQIERATEGAVSRNDLRPDLFGEPLPAVANS